MAVKATPGGVPERLVDAAIKLLAEQGPSAIKVRAVASACGLSTMVVYSHFGGVPELTRAVADRGFTELGRAFARIPVTDDPVMDLFAMAAACRRLARENPHLYDLMFGLSTRATYRPDRDAGGRLSGHSPAFRDAYAHVAEACTRLVSSGRTSPAEPEVVAAQLWSFVHGFISLELADHFAEFADPLAEVLLPMGVTFCVGLGDSPERARASHEEAVSRYGELLREPS
ncbi:TetR/AcrR family transcriptional regulator [Streptomyces boninensis]|uniref:TetR/AcrR family transcriptional regulator n=1 Tax=Streptomyces boninensis TaxID=2039455 RepID=UPI003B223BE5